MFLAVPVRASDSREELAEAMGVDGLEEVAEDTGLAEYGSVMDGFDTENALKELMSQALKAAASPAVIRSLMSVLTIILLLAAVRTVAGLSGAAIDAASLAGCCAVLLLVGGSRTGMTSLAESVILKLQDMANALLPVLGSAALLSGQVTSAAAKYSAAALFMNVLINLSCSFVLPLARLYLAAAAAEAAAGGGVMSGVLSFLKWCGATVLSILMTVFTLYLSLTAMAANSADAAVVRSAKTAVATMLPVVGSIAGDAASSLLAAAGMIRQAVGTFGLLAVSSVLLAPFFQTGVRYLLFKGAAAISAELTEKRLSRLLQRISEALALTMGCIGSCGMMLFFSIFALLRTAAV